MSFTFPFKYSSTLVLFVLFVLAVTCTCYRILRIFLSVLTFCAPLLHTMILEVVVCELCESDGSGDVRNTTLLLPILQRGSGDDDDDDDGGGGFEAYPAPP